MPFWECSVTHGPGEEPLDVIGCFPVFSGVQVASDFLEVLLIPIGLFQTLCNLSLVFLGDISQYRPGTVDRAHLLGCAEEGGFSRLWMPVCPSEMTS